MTEGNCLITWKLQKNADAPVPKRGRRLQWTIPLVDIKPGDMMVLDMSPVEAHKKVNAVRSFVSREQKKMGLKFSVYITDSGIAIFRRSENE